MATKRIYMDVCALSRPFDDQTITRSQIETGAVWLIWNYIRQHEYQTILSPVHEAEIRASANAGEREDLLNHLGEWAVRVDWDSGYMRTRIKALIENGLGIADAAHVVFAETFSEVFVTCDDALLRKCRKRVAIPAMNPIEFVVSEGLS